MLNVYAFRTPKTVARDGDLQFNSQSRYGAGSNPCDRFYSPPWPLRPLYLTMSIHRKRDQLAFAEVDDQSQFFDNAFIGNWTRILDTDKAANNGTLTYTTSVGATMEFWFDGTCMPTSFFLIPSDFLPRFHGSNIRCSDEWYYIPIRYIHDRWRVSRRIFSLDGPR